MNMLNCFVFQETRRLMRVEKSILTIDNIRNAGLLFYFGKKSQKILLDAFLPETSLNIYFVITVYPVRQIALWQKKCCYFFK